MITDGVSCIWLDRQEDDDISEWGDSNGPESSNNASNSGRDQWLPIIKMVYEDSDNDTDSK